jgi:CarD family transcriptional regulator
MFQVGERIVHPDYGVGTVTEIKERHTLGPGKRYYSLELLNQPEMVVMVPVGSEERLKLRRPVVETKLDQVWRVLRDDPQTLPSGHEKRCTLLEEKLSSGDVFAIAEVLRDLTWWRDEKRHLTIRGKQLYERGMALLAGEVASVQGRDLVDAEMLISGVLDKSLHAAGQM